RMLKLEHSLEFDLQGLVDLIATLFPTNSAYCLISGSAEQATMRSFSLGEILELDASERLRLLDFRESLGNGTVMDNDGGTLLDFEGRITRRFDEADRRIAFLLAKNDLTVSLLKPFNIGRAKGMMLVALPPVDAIVLHEAGLICQTLDTLFPTLDSIAEAERNFIADAHDVARRDLHDGVLQTLAAVRMRLLSIGRQKDMKGHPAQAAIIKVADILTLEQARLRGLLEISEDEDHGINLVTRLDVGLRTISMQWEIDAKLEAEEPAIPIDKESAINIEHLVREAVANAVRHADSRQLTVRLSLTHNSLRIAIIDRNDDARPKGAKKGRESMPLRSASLLHRLRLVNGSAYADGLENRAILAITIPMQRLEHA
ncbi:MAG: sensor histidine kinase, partial [Sphingorhabdus sp.]